MRIGIITHHWVFNFGSNLQAISTNRLLRKMGHEAWIINYRPPVKEEEYRRIVSPEQVEQHEEACQRFMDQTPLCRTETDIINVSKEFQFDQILVGSDAVFRLVEGVAREDLQFPNPYWLQWTGSCTHPVPRTGSLAASAMGTNFLRIPNSIRKGVRQAVSNMHFVSVRDRWTQLMLFFVSNGRAWPTLCPDPVFLLNDALELPDDYSIRFPFGDDRYVLLSLYPGTFADEWIQEFVQLAHQRALCVVSLPTPEQRVDLPVDYILPLPLSPLHWYSLIKNAVGFIGFRMHPIVCCIVNSVPFISIDDYVTSKLRIYRKAFGLRFSSKTYDLCSRAGVGKFCLYKKQVRRLTPAGAFDMLNSREQANAEKFIPRAKRDFKRVISEILLRSA